MFGCIFERETEVGPRRLAHYASRSMSVVWILGLIITAWLLLNGVQPIVDAGDMSSFGSLVLPIVVPLATVVLVFVTAVASVLSVTHEKDRKTLDLLLISSLSNSEIVIGKTWAGLGVGINAALPTIVAIGSVQLFGGVSSWQVLSIGWVIVTAVFAAACWGACIGFWREKTFQAIAICLLGLVLGAALFEAIKVWEPVGGFIPRFFRPISTLLGLLLPVHDRDSIVIESLGCGLFLVAIGICLTTVSIGLLRIWNPSRIAPKKESETREGLTAGDARLNPSWRGRASRSVWTNPVLWREIRTWAYGRRVLVIRFAYLLLAAFIGYGLWQLTQSGEIYQRSYLERELLPSSARWMGAFIVASLVIVNALAVNAITNERDASTLELVLASQLSSQQFLFGKILGVFFVAKEMVLLPMIAVGGLWWIDVISSETLVFTIVALLVMNLFVTMLGLHCGMIYSRSRSAIGTSLGTVFFLFIGIVACMLMMISFRGSFERQLAPFLGIILGGGASLYFSIGSKRPSPALVLASFGLPFLMFFAMTSFLLRDQELTVFSVIVGAYGFTTVAMLVPAISEFEFEMGRETQPSIDE